MTPGTDLSAIIAAARKNYEDLNGDIKNASSRIEHIRLTGFAQSAQNLLFDLIAHDNGDSYAASAGQDTPLPIEDFVSPFNPDL
jgi:hypothetical protein